MNLLRVFSRPFTRNGRRLGQDHSTASVMMKRCQSTDYIGGHSQSLLQHCVQQQVTNGLLDDTADVQSAVNYIKAVIVVGR